MTRRPRLGLLGGTFDPIHVGHLAAARAAQQALALDAVRFIPSRYPPHRSDGPHASAYHRVAMARLAIADATAGDARWEVSDLEPRRPGPSFTVDTLGALHAAGFTPHQLYFVVGADAFAEVASWARYPAVLDAAQFAVVARPGTTLASLEERLPDLASRMRYPAEADRSTTTAVILVEAETPAVSSTEIRRRAAAGSPLAGLVTPAVAAYIEAQGLYHSGGAGADPAPIGDGSAAGRAAPQEEGR